MTQTTSMTIDRWIVERPEGSDSSRLERDSAQERQKVLKLTVHATEIIEAAFRGRHPVVRGQAYCLKAQVRTALGNAHGRLFLQWMDAQGKALGEDASKHTFLVHDYAPLYVWAVAPPVQSSARPPR